jgi:hypothetical protein
LLTSASFFTGDADVKFSIVVFAACVLLATRAISAGVVSDRLAVIAAIPIGGYYCNRRSPTTPRDFSIAGAFT